jgi:predicted nicotinamide N-methyase
MQTSIPLMCVQRCVCSFLNETRSMSSAKRCAALPHRTAPPFHPACSAWAPGVQLDSTPQMPHMTTVVVMMAITAGPCLVGNNAAAPPGHPSVGATPPSTSLHCSWKLPHCALFCCRPMAWIHDVFVDSRPMSTTGGHTWAAAYRLADYLAAAFAELGLSQPGLRIIELGSGTGWLGATVARNCPSASLVCLTEQEGGVPWLQHNVELNRQRGLGLANVRVQACDWRHVATGGGGGGGGSGTGDQQPARPPAAAAVAAAAGDDAPPIDLQGTAWDLCLGSDLIYNEVGSTCLPRVLAALAGPSTCILYCHTKHRFDLLDLEFFQNLEACGLECKEVGGACRGTCWGACWMLARGCPTPALLLPLRQSMLAPASPPPRPPACLQVWEPGVPPPPQSPPLQFPPAELFPEQRIAVYRISRKADAGLAAAAVGADVTAAGAAEAGAAGAVTGAGDAGAVEVGAA